MFAFTHSLQYFSKHFLQAKILEKISMNNIQQWVKEKKLALLGQGS